MTVNNRIALAQWRRTVTETYAEVRRLGKTDRRSAWTFFLKTRNALFAQHPQTPLSRAQKRSFSAIPMYEYNPDYATVGRLNFDQPQQEEEIVLDVDGSFRTIRFAQVNFSLFEVDHLLNLYWIKGYGGGLYLPFGDLTNGDTTYGGGRYLYDGIKGADLGMEGEQIVLDFNFAYNPSCAYNDQWSCPLPPAENKLPVCVEAGEKRFV